MSKKVFIIGYFGYGSGKLDGQTVKTRNMSELIRKHGESRYVIREYDTERFRSNPFSLFGILKNGAWCDSLIIIPQFNSLGYVFPVVYVLSRIFRFDVIHVPIGSRQAEFFGKKKWFRKAYLRMAKKIRAFLLEVSGVEKEMRDEFGFSNTGVLYNFRVHDFAPEISNRDKGLKIVFMSRINPGKGIDVIFKIGEYLREEYPAGDVTIDIYGQVTEDEEGFSRGVAANGLIEYKGWLAPADIYITLNRYDILLLPTRYYTEGFPGAVLDAYISGIPVLVSKWAFSDEFVRDGVTGFIHDVDDTAAFCNTIDRLYNDSEELLARKRSAWEESKKYSEGEAWREIEKFLVP